MIGTGTAIALGISAAASAYSAHKQASAAKDAAKAQTESSDKALGLETRMYDESQKRLAPYQQLGQGAIGPLGYLMGMPQGGPAVGQGASLAPLVTVRAPTGEMKQVPAAQAAWYQSKGATVLNVGNPPTSMAPSVPGVPMGAKGPGGIPIGTAIPRQ